MGVVWGGNRAKMARTGRSQQLDDQRSSEVIRGHQRSSGVSGWMISGDGGGWGRRGEGFADELSVMVDLLIDEGVDPAGDKLIALRPRHAVQRQLHESVAEVNLEVARFAIGARREDH